MLAYGRIVTLPPGPGNTSGATGTISRPIPHTQNGVGLYSALISATTRGTREPSSLRIKPVAGAR